MPLRGQRRQRGGGDRRRQPTSRRGRHQPDQRDTAGETPYRDHGVLQESHCRVLLECQNLVCPDREGVALESERSIGRDEGVEPRRCRGMALPARRPEAP